ncbi:hypothetical protein DUI87_18609 [Hirundo rustica rustica]|uniref:Uncharacterized protein n=1 Tax=Hirundo rustica rustica TaxID=333673 RepID=A0A3M0JXD3_HIRRU|nr:hypothetical protein DUI87_18609 [Hirundo rustica rustica]
MATAKKRREVSSLPLITTCKECNKTVWIGGKKESTFVGYLQVNPLCYDKRKLKMCALNGKTYWVGQNEKLQTATLANGPILLDMLGENDERVCLRMDKVFCFSKDEEGLDPENKIQKVALEFKRQELAAKKKRMEQERMRTLSEQYDQLEKQSNDWSLATSSKNLFLDLVQEIATELGLTNCWICGGLKSAERWPWKDALELLAKQHSQMRAFVYQNRIALDYLLAEEGGVCGKFNDSECCIEINDYGETIRDLAAEIKKVAHVPVQKWNSILKASWWDQIFGTGDWWKKVGFFILCSVAGLVFLPCLIPCLIRLIHTVVQGMQIAALPMDPELASGGLAKEKATSKIMNLTEEKKYCGSGVRKI